MPWRELSVVKQREEFVSLASASGAKIAPLCRRFGISRSKGYKWLGRFKKLGLEGLKDKSRRPHKSPQRTVATIESAVLCIRDESNNAWGGRKISHVLSVEQQTKVAPSTITEILRRHGKLEANSKEHPGAPQRFERAQPNELLQMDYMGHFPMLVGRCHPLTVLDDHSRYCVGLWACGDETAVRTRDCLTTIFRCYGLPYSMLMDNGPPWGDPMGGPYTTLSVWLMQLGIRVLHGRPYHPQTQGKDERFHRTLQAELVNGRSFRDLEDCQNSFDRWRNVYNHRRPHEAIGMMTPDKRYQPSPRAFPETLPPIEYTSGDFVRKVDGEGCVSFKGRPIRVGKPFRHLPVALRPSTEDGQYDVHFCAHRIGTLDLRTVPVKAWGFVDIAKPHHSKHPHGDVHNSPSPPPTSDSSND